MDDLLDTAPCGFLTLADDGSVLAANTTLLAWVGLAREELLGRHVDAILPVASRIFFQTHVTPLLRVQGRVEELYLTLRSVGGADVPVLLNAARRERDGAPANDLVLVPMRQRYRFEDELLRAKREAEEAVRTRDRANAELVAARADLERQVRDRTAELRARNEEQETFVYTVSHDLRQPLLSIAGMSELLDVAVRDGDASASTFLLRRVKTNVGRMQELLDDLLAISRAGRAVEAPGALSLGEVVTRALDELGPRLEARGVAVEAPVEWPTVLYPATDAYQVVANLLGNAAKWAGRRDPSGAGGDTPHPRVRLGWTLADHDVALRVEDDGPGVPAEYRAKVFGLFQKLDAAAEGTGVGLAIVKRVAERHGGRVWVEDSVLGGASFTVTFPRA